MNDVIIQLVTKIVFYTLGYLGIYLSLREYSFYKNELVYPLALNSVAFFFCTNLILFDLTRTWLHLFYIFCFLVPMFIYNGLKYLRTGSFKFLVFFLILSYINTPIFTNISYPPIQFLTIFSILFILEGRQIKLKRLSALFFFYFVVNIPSLIENIILIMQLKDLFVNSDFNKTLIEDYSTTQKNFFSLVNIIQNISGRLFSENWSYQGKIPQFYFSELYTSLFKIINIVPLLLIFLSFIKNTYQRQNKKMLYLLMVYLIAIPLTTMQGFPPLYSFFSYLFTHFTEIGVFRNSLKFSVLLMTVLCFIIYFIINKKKGYTVFFLCYVLLLNTYSFAGQFSNYYAFGSMPENYKKLENILATLPINDSDKCFIYPASDKIWYGFTFNYFGFSPFINSQNNIPCISKTSSLSSSANKIIYDKFKNIDNVSLSDFENYQVRYLVLHKDINYTIFGQKNNYTKTALTLDTNYRKVIDNDNYSIYETYKESSPLISSCKQDSLTSTHITYTKLSPVKYSITLTGLADDTDICFLKGFSKFWELSVESYNKPNITIANDSHRQTIEGFNKWTIEAQKIKEQLPEEYYTKNSEQEISFKINLYFKIQKLVTFSIFITIFLVIAGLSFVKYKKI